ncbi:MAG: ABC transporter permease [Chloroflexia bacterium]
MAEISKPAPVGGPGAAARSGSRALAEAAFKTRKPRTLWTDAWRQYRKHKLAMVGSALLFTIILVCAIGPFIYTVSPTQIDIAKGFVPPPIEIITPIRPKPLGLQAPSIKILRPVWQGPMGYTDLGLDIFAQVMSGGRKSLLVGLMAVIVSITVGTLVGAIAGFFGRGIDATLMRLTDLFLALPQLPLLLLITYLYMNGLKKSFGSFGNWLLNKFGSNFGISSETAILVLIVCVIGILNWMSTARLVRASFLSLKEKEFVEAARCIGATTPSIIFKHILPNVLSPIIVAATLGVGAAIISESTLSFLGLGFPPDVPTWGSMLSIARDQLDLNPYIPLFPGIMIFLVVLSINYMGDGLRDALDPRGRV